MEAHVSICWDSEGVESCFYLGNSLVCDLWETTDPNGLQAAIEWATKWADSRGLALEYDMDQVRIVANNKIGLLDLPIKRKETT